MTTVRQIQQLAEDFYHLKHDILTANNTVATLKSRIDYLENLILDHHQHHNTTTTVFAAQNFKLLVVRKKARVTREELTFILLDNGFSPEDIDVAKTAYSHKIPKHCINIRETSPEARESVLLELPHVDLPVAIRNNQHLLHIVRDIVTLRDAYGATLEAAADLRRASRLRESILLRYFSNYPNTSVSVFDATVFRDTDLKNPPKNLVVRRLLESGWSTNKIDTYYRLEKSPTERMELTIAAL